MLILSLTQNNQLRIKQKQPQTPLTVTLQTLRNLLQMIHLEQIFYQDDLEEFENFQTVMESAYINKNNLFHEQYM